MRYTPKGKYYVSSVEEAEQYRLCLKLQPCPHCGSVGFLVCHGFLRGYDEHGEFSVRGWRVFCSNRFRRKGCGGTFSFTLDSVLRRLSISSHTLWGLVCAIAAGAGIKAAWKNAKTSCSLQTVYRLWRRLKFAQSSLRTLLCRESSPPPCLAANPLTQLLEHIKTVFPNASCPFAALQNRFQRFLLA